MNAPAMTPASEPDQPSRELAQRPEDQHRKAGTPLYVHLPFCVVKCTYCDFFSAAEHRGRPVVDQDLSFVLEDLLREADRRAPREPVTVFLGGGTPSIHGAEELAGFLLRLDAATGFRSSAVEVTMECNPESLDFETAQAALENGVDRLSIGVQTLDLATLTAFGRAHGPEEARAAVQAARRAGCTNLNLDLIYGAPTQQLPAWRGELREVLAWQPDHVSAYSLAYEEGTLMTKWRSQGRIHELDEDTALAFFESARGDLQAAGYPPYEVSNFTAGKLCLHNLNAWWNGPYVGLGPSAVSCLDGVRFGQARSVRAWQAALAEAGPRLAMAWEEALDVDARRAESWWLGLRCTQGVDVQRLERGVRNDWDARTFLEDAEDERRRHRGKADDEAPEPVRDRLAPTAPNRPQPTPHSALAEKLEAAGWLERDGFRWRLSDHAWPLADAIARRFLLLSPRAAKGPEVLGS